MNEETLVAGIIVEEATGDPVAGIIMPDETGDPVALSADDIQPCI